MIRGVHCTGKLQYSGSIDILNLLNLGVSMIRGVQVNLSTPGVSGYLELAKPKSKHDHE